MRLHLFRPDPALLTERRYVGSPFAAKARTASPGPLTTLKVLVVEDPENFVSQLAKKYKGDYPYAKIPDKKSKRQE